MSKDLWLAEYEALPDRYGDLVEKHGEEQARKEIGADLKRLGFDPHEIDDHLSAFAA